MPEGMAPWVQGAEPAKYFGPMFGEAAAAASRKSQLQAEMMRAMMQQSQHAASIAADQERAAQDIELKKQIQHQNLLMDQQKLLVEQQYKVAQASAAQQRVEETAKKNQLAAMQAARKLQAEQAINQEIQQGLERNPNANPDQLRIQAIAAHGAELGVPGSGYGSIATALGKFAPPPAVQFGTSPITQKPYAQIGNRLSWEPNAPQGRQLRKTPEEEMISEINKAKVRTITTAISQLYKDRALLKKQKDIDKIDQQIREQRDKLDELSPAGGSPVAEGRGPIKIPMIGGKLVRPPELMSKDEARKELGKAIEKATAAPASPAAAGPSPWARPTPPGFGPAMLPPAMTQPPAPQAPPAAPQGAQPAGRGMLSQIGGIYNDLNKYRLTAWGRGQDPNNPEPHFGINTTDELASRKALQEQQAMLAARRKARGLSQVTLPNETQYRTGGDRPTPDTSVPRGVPVTEMQWQSPQEVLRMHAKGVIDRDTANKIISDRWPDSGIEVGAEPQYSP